MNSRTPTSRPRHGSSRTLFDLPLPIPEETIYRELNLDPTSTPEEIGWAVKFLNDKRLAERRQLEVQQNATFLKIPRLEEAYKQLQDLQVSGRPDEAQVRHVQRQVAELEASAANVDPGFQERRRKIKDLSQKIDELNLMNLKEPEKQRRYERRHPPLALFKLIPATRDDFLEQPRTALWLLRRDVMKFLDSKGETVVYTNDLDREDFTADFLPNPILDEQSD